MSSLGSSGTVRGKRRLLVNRRAQWHPSEHSRSNSASPPTRVDALRTRFFPPDPMAAGVHEENGSRRAELDLILDFTINDDLAATVAAVLLPRPPNILPDAGGSCPVRTRSRITVRNCSSSMGSRAQVQKGTLVLAMVAADSFTTITTSD